MRLENGGDREGSERLDSVNAWLISLIFAIMLGYSALCPGIF